MEIAKMLTLSTAHISEESVVMLEREVDKDKMGLIVYTKGEFGFWIYCPAALIEDEEYGKEYIPEDIWNCMKLAQDNDCTWLCLDCDGEIIDELPTFEWES